MTLGRRRSVVGLGKEHSGERGEILADGLHHVLVQRVGVGPLFGCERFGGGATGGMRLGGHRGILPEVWNLNRRSSYHPTSPKIHQLP